MHSPLTPPNPRGSPVVNGHLISDHGEVLTVDLSSGVPTFSLSRQLPLSSTFDFLSMCLCWNKHVIAELLFFLSWGNPRNTVTVLFPLSKTPCNHLIKQRYCITVDQNHVKISRGSCEYCHKRYRMVPNEVTIVNQSVDLEKKTMH